MSSKSKRYTVGEEIFNSVSHGVGALLSIIGATVIVTLAVCFGDMNAVVTCVIYGLSLIMLYTMSTLYHAFPFKTVKKVFRVFDHTSIFLLIAGTYTPFCLIALRGNPKSVMVISIIWLCAGLGIALTAFAMEKTEKLNLILYIAMGWSVILVLKDIMAVLKGNGLALLVLGGLFYTVGIIFYVSKTPYMHSIWHLFVMGGSICHFICIVKNVLPMSFI